MKKCFVTVFVLLCSLGLYAQTTNLVFFSEDLSGFYVAVNGIRQNPEPESHVKVAGLKRSEFGGWRVLITFENNEKVEQNIPSPESDSEITFNIRRNKKGKLTLQYMGETPISQSVAQKAKVYDYSPTERKPGVGQVNPSPDKTPKDTDEFNFKMNIDLPTTEPNGNPANVRTNIKTNPNQVEVDVMDVKVDVKVQGIPDSQDTPDNQVKTPRKPAPDSQPAARAKNTCRTPMTNATFGALKTSLNSKSFEEDKVTTYKQAVRNNCVSVAQVKELLELFTFEESKLELAKFSYERCTNPQDYFQVNDVFTFSGSITELDNFIQNK